MVQNIKVDVIYYKTPTDFEMEFNLCGCCRMRMLTDKTSDRRSFIHSLSRAVSRSRIIICSGPLFESEGLINSVAIAIGKPLEQADFSKYRIRSNEPVPIIRGSMPLVTAEGIFGGCIIESGPQSIILLTENRGVRKMLMSSLIHPYIEELSVLSSAPATSAVNPSQAADAVIEPSAETVAPQSVTEPAAEFPEAAVTAQEADAVPEDAAALEENNIDEQTSDEISETAEEDSVDETAEPHTDEVCSAGDASDASVPESDNAKTSDNVKIAEDKENTAAETPADETGTEPEKTPEEAPAETARFEKAPVPETTDIETELYFEPQRAKFRKKNYYDNSYGDEAEDGGYVTDDGNNMLPPQRSFRIPVVIITVVLLIALLALVYLLVFIPLRSGTTPGKYISSLFETAAVSAFGGIINV